MNKKEETALKNLWKVKMLQQMNEVEKEMGGGRVERSCESDNEKSLNFIKYGFEEGIKFVKSQKGRGWRKSVVL